MNSDSTCLAFRSRAPIPRRRLLSGARLCLLSGSVFLLSSAVPLSALAQEAPPSDLPPLEVHVDLDRVDLEARKLEVTMSRPAARVVLKVFDASGLLIDESETSFNDKAAGATLLVRWKQSKEQSVARIDVYAYDTFDYYKAVRITPWSLSIPHEDVQFATNSAQIVAAEEPKLEASYKLIADAFKQHRELGNITLFIAGHTDTMGSAAHNLELSQKRARAIAGWFRARGHKGPIAYAGFGEHALKVATADQVDEARNRRVDYLLGLSPPRIKSAGKVSWKSL